MSKADDLIGELEAAGAGWARASHAWNKSDETNYIKVIEQGENLYAAACRMIEVQADIIDAAAEVTVARDLAIESALIELLNSLMVCRQRADDGPFRQATGVGTVRFWTAYDKAHAALCLPKSPVETAA